VSFRAVYSVINDKTNPTTTTLNKLAAALDVEPAEFFAPTETEREPDSTDAPLVLKDGWMDRLSHEVAERQMIVAAAVNDYGLSFMKAMQPALAAFAEKEKQLRSA
jgi:transcriptional regulator with XRE-family HTH domain